MNEWIPLLSLIFIILFLSIYFNYDTFWNTCWQYWLEKRLNKVQKTINLFSRVGSPRLHCEGFGSVPGNVPGLDLYSFIWLVFVRKPLAHPPIPVQALCQMKYVKYSQFFETFHPACQVSSLCLDCELRLGSAISRSRCASSGSLSLVCRVFKLVTVDAESDVRPLRHFTPAWLKEPVPPVKRLPTWTASNFSASAPLKAHLFFVPFRRYLSLFHLDGIKAVMNKLQAL